MSQTTTTITITVDTATAQKYLAASANEQQLLERMLNLYLRELVNQPHQFLLAIMDEIGANAQSRGLTPKILETLLDETGQASQLDVS